MKKEFLNYINSFRGIAILYIVLGHCLSAFVWTDMSGVGEVIHVTFTNGTVLFVFIAGYLFQYLSPRYAYGRYMKSKLLNVGMPYLIMSVPGILYFTLFAQRPGMEYVNDWPWILQVVQFYLVGAQLVPFWFIPMIFIHFILSPIYIRGDRQGWLYYLLPVFFLISMFVWRGGPYQLQSYLHYAFVYFFGMYAARNRDWLNPLLSKTGNLLAMLAVIATMAFIELDTAHAGIGIARLNFVQHLIQCLCYIGLLVRFDAVIGRRLDMFASLSFGIFFVHSYIISIFKLGYARAFGHLPEATIPGFTLFFIGIVMLSMLFVLQVRRIFGKRSRMICGS